MFVLLSSFVPGLKRRFDRHAAGAGHEENVPQVIRDMNKAFDDGHYDCDLIEFLDNRKAVLERHPRFSAQENAFTRIAHRNDATLAARDLERAYKDGHFDGGVEEFAVQHRRLMIG